MNTLTALDMRLIINDVNFAIEMLAMGSDAARAAARKYMSSVRAELMRASVNPVAVQTARDPESVS